MKGKITYFLVVAVMLTLIGLAFVYDSILSGVLLTIIFGGILWIKRLFRGFRIF
jgi:hypothetical protein